MTTIVANGASTTESTVRLQITVDAALLSGDVIEVLRSGQVLPGAPTPTGSLTYQYIDTPGIGQHSYAARVARGQITTLSAPYRITAAPAPPPPPAYPAGALFFDTFSYADNSGGIAPVNSTPELGTWTASGSSELRINNGILFSIAPSATGTSNPLVAPSNGYTLELQFSVSASPSASGNFKIELTDGTAPGQLRAWAKVTYQAGVFIGVNLDVKDGNFVSYGANGNLSSLPAGVIHTLAIEIKANYYNFKINGVDLGPFGPFKLGATGLLNPKIQLQINDGAAPTANYFTFTKLAVFDGVVVPVDPD